MVAVCGPRVLSLSRASHGAALEQVTWIVAACTAAFTWERIRRARFELFYVTHALMIVVVGMACFHSWYSTGYLVWIMIVPGAMYVYDRVARHAAGRRFARICALVPEPGVTRVEYVARDTHMRFPCGPAHSTYVPTPMCHVTGCRYEIADLRAYAPGQFAFLNIPALGEIEWHPFSISSAPPAVVVTGESEVVRLSHHIKVRAHPSPAARPPPSAACDSAHRTWVRARGRTSCTSWRSRLRRGRCARRTSTCAWTAPMAARRAGRTATTAREARTTRLCSSRGASARRRC